ncbi:MAG: PEGA domain-containing protein [bacterium]|nr:PEGA domain-containing protein [bacterium]
MKKMIYLWLMVLIFSMAACTVHIPYDWGVGHRDYRIILLVEPDDAEVLLDGKLIGLAYEFSAEESVLRLPSRNHELVIKKKGYREEAIDLYDYSSRDITLRVKLSKQRDYYEPAVKKEKAGKKKAKTEYIPKTEPMKEPPKKIEDEPIMKGKPVKVTLEISPTESSIYLNGKFWGISPASGRIENLRLKPGKYSLEVIKPGYKEYQKKLTVKDKDIKLSIKLLK